ncbi:MAG: sel1 repeat family protein [Sandaracinaceae bacterium]|nr:sel1 repeat family protein [Sandaracinaceae bacterium]
MTTHGSPARPLGALLLALALSGCGAASPPPPTTQVEATPPACTSYQELRGDRCMYVVEAEERCHEADGAACTAAGEAYLLSGQAAGDVEHAAELYARACELGDAEGCNRLGSLHEDGDGVRWTRPRRRGSTPPGVSWGARRRARSMAPCWPTGTP